ncbi:hypothetical protein EYF80_016336 [Liparis tanakae]|uniref:Uncharacterized protein n=1 Tax=Liparis tanakae TaxID=230148 RepID=A0A4Z2I7W3_9TELE|nr:hypothetical protein EYF80_016336 [Liparis tanakae]
MVNILDSPTGVHTTQERENGEINCLTKTGHLGTCEFAKWMPQSGNLTRRLNWPMRKALNTVQKREKRRDGERWMEVKREHHWRRRGVDV